MKIPPLLSMALITGLATSFPVLADQKLEQPPEIKEEHTPPAEVIDREKEHLPEPEVRIIKRKKVTIEEYRVNGQLRYAKIIPTSGPAYYLVDTDGDGELETRHDNMKNPPIQQWILYQW
ncbi:MAG: DUF2782 domain-containing protein [Gammaproteobacteria bacterium]|nr:DUF2782 domain-containing protein [Gammaproteobacteria bacterium]